MNLPQVECLIILGRGIEKIQTSHGEVWRPTHYIQEIDAHGIRTGRRKEGLDPNADRVLIAGGEINIQAGIEYYKYLNTIHIPPKLIIFAAGRPSYLDGEPAGFSEGDVLKHVFDEEIKTPYESLILRDDRNTKDDVINAIRICQERGYKEVALINIEIAMERTKLFYEVQQSELGGPCVIFMTSESILRDVYATDPVAVEKFEREQIDLRQSRAWKVTSEREQGGIQALKSGTYQGKGKY